MTSAGVRGWALALATVALVTPAVVWSAKAEAQPLQSAPPVRLAKIQFDPPGADDGTNSSLNKEWVQVHNYGAKAWKLTGWSIRDITGYKFVFPDGFTLQPGTTVTVHTGSGTNRALNLYWGQGSYIWNNDGDKATFKNGAAKVVDTCAYTGSGSWVTC